MDKMTLLPWDVDSYGLLEFENQDLMTISEVQP